MLKLSKLTDYGTVVMTALARAPEKVSNASGLATQTQISTPTVRKLLKRLVRAGLLESTRGASGGYRLIRAPEDISMADVIAALEGPIGLTECARHEGQCDIETNCRLRANWQVINQAVRGALDSVSLADMVSPLQQFQVQPEQHTLHKMAMPGHGH